MNSFMFMLCPTAVCIRLCSWLVGAQYFAPAPSMSAPFAKNTLK